MKKISVALLCLMSTTAFAIKAGDHLPKYMRISHASLKSDKPVKAQMGCDLYQFDDNYNPTFLTSESSSIFDVGTMTSMNIDFPSPYQGVSVYFEHENILFAIDNFQTDRPFISSAIIYDGGKYSDYKNATFSVENAKSGSRISLHNVYRLNENIMLFSLCSIKFV